MATDISRSYNEHLRRVFKRSKADIRCGLCGSEIIDDGTVGGGAPGGGAGGGAGAGGGPNTLRSAFEAHIVAAHAQLLDEKTTADERRVWLAEQWKSAQVTRDAKSEAIPPTMIPADEGAKPQSNRGPPARRKLLGPTSPSAAAPPEDPARSRSPSPPKRAHAAHAARPAPPAGLAEFDRGPLLEKGKKLWNEADPAAPSSRPRAQDKSNVGAFQRQQRRQPHTAPRVAPPADHGSPDTILKQPETRAISQEQLVAEVKGIYAGLVMVESKCIEVDNNQSSPNDPDKRLNNQQWQAMIALHRTLLQEHHDFFLASQHPSASAALRRLAAKYAMPARMWRHGIHSFLELLRHRLPGSLDHMLTFIYMAYSMMALLYETVPAFEDTWIECLGDLGRYRMAIEDDDIRDREVWTAVSRQWYSRASDKAPTTGRLYHHLAILSRPNALQQLSYYSKSLNVEIPFPSAKESIMTLFEPTMSPQARNPQHAKLPPTELSFVKAHGILFSGKHQDEFDVTMDSYLGLVDNHISRSTRRWLESGYHTAIANIGALTGYGGESNPINVARKADARLRRPDDAESTDQSTQGTARSETTASAKSGNNNNNNNNSAKTIPNAKQFPNSLRLLVGTYNVVCRRFADSNILPYLHVTLAFVFDLTLLPDAMAHVAPVFPWKLTALMLNTLMGTASSSTAHNVSQAQAQARLLEVGAPFPGTEVANTATVTATSDKEGDKAPPVRRKRPLPDDYAMRGFQWAERYHPDGWFDTDERIDDDDKYFEVPSMMEERRERVLWLGARIAEREGGRWLQLDRETKRFGWNPEYEVELGLEQPLPPTPGESVELGELPDAGTVA